MGGFERRDGLDVDVAFHAFRCVGAGVACRALEAGFGSVVRTSAFVFVRACRVSFIRFQSCGAPGGGGLALRCIEEVRRHFFYEILGDGGDGAHGGFPVDFVIGCFGSLAASQGVHGVLCRDGSKF